MNKHHKKPITIKGVINKIQSLRCSLMFAIIPANHYRSVGSSQLKKSAHPITQLAKKLKPTNKNCNFSMKSSCSSVLPKATLVIRIAGEI